MIDRLERLNLLLDRLEAARNTLLRAAGTMADFNHQRSETLALMTKTLQNQIDFVRDEIRKMEER